MPRVSVIVPAYNARDTIGATLESIVAQTVGDWEAIVIDDASADDTADVAADVSAKVRVLRSPANQGPAGAMNRGLAEARGELVSFLGADDWWEPEYLASQLAVYDSESKRPGPPVGIVTPDARVMEGGELLPGTYYDQFRRGVEPVTVERLLRRNVVFGGVIIPRAVGEEVGWFDAGLRLAEDWGLWLKVAERGYRIVVNRKPLAVYRRTAHSLTRNVANQAANNRRMLEATLARGRLTAPQQRIARQEIRYNRALEAVSAAAAGGGAARLVRHAPTVAWVAATRPRNWPDWWRALRRS